MAVTLDIDGSVEKISAKLRQTRRELEGVAEGYDSIDEASKSAVNGAVSGQEKMASSTSKTSKELNKQTSMIDKLEAHLKRLEKGQKKTNDPQKIKKYNAEIVKTRAALSSLKTSGSGGLAAVNTSARASIGIFTSLRGVLASTFAPLFAVGAAFEGVRRIVGLVNEYEQTAADLSAITGASGETLEFLKQSAVEVGLETTASAGQTLEAYKLIASAKPELLDNAEGLATITREAVALTEAMGGELPQAATNLTDIMNQFNAPADEASRFVNALAAGSKEGSAEVDQLAQSFLVSGSSMKSANVQFEEGVGLIESLAERGVKGAEAGTALRNVLTRLSATDVLPKQAVARLNAAGVNMDALSDKSLSFSDRLRALNPIQNDANALVSVFGLENLNAARILLEQTDRVDELTTAVTGTNTAYEQAAIRTSTARGEFAKLRNTIQAVIQDNGTGLSRFIALIIRFVREGVLVLKSGIDDLKPTFEVFANLVGNLFSAIRNLLPEQEKAADGVSLWTRVIQLINIPLKVFFQFLNNGITIITGLVNGFGRLVAGNRTLQSFFNNISKSASTVFDIFLDLPSYVAAGLAAIRTFVVETGRSIGRLGSNVGAVLREAFDFGKLIQDGAGDLNAAVNNILSNPFEGVGSKAAQAFTDEFNKSKEELTVPVKVETQVEGLEPGEEPDVVNNQSSFSRVENNAAKQAEREAKELARLEAAKQKAVLDAMVDGRDKQLALEQVRYDDLIERLEEFNLETEDAAYQHELNKFKIKQQFLDQIADLEGLSGQERIDFLYNQTKAEIDAIESALSEANGGSLAEEQIRQLNRLRQNATEEYLARTEEFQSEEQRKAQEHEINLLELKREGFDSQAAFEEFKEQEILNIRLRYAEAQLAILERLNGADDDAALALRRTINQIKGDLADIENSGGASSGFSLFSLLGLDPDDPKNQGIIDGINTAASTTIDILTDVNKLRLQTAQEAIDSADAEIKAIDDEIEAKKKQLENEKSLADEGFANNAQAVQREIDLLKSQQEAESAERDKALEEKKKIQRQQEIVNTISQASNLITASTSVFNSVSAIPFAGPAIGAALVAAMIGSFIASKRKVFQAINQQKAEKGMFGVVKGRRHSDGGERFGDHIEVEDGEAFGVLSRNATKKYGKQYKAFVNAANKNDRLGMARVAEMFGSGLRIDRGSAERIQDKESNVVTLNTQVTAEVYSSELRENNRLLKAMIADRKKPTTSIEYKGNRKIVRTGNSTRTIRTQANG